MELTIDLPGVGNTLRVSLLSGESLITERGALLSATGDYDFTNRLELKDSRSILMKMLGKSLSFNCYVARSDCRLLLAPKAIDRVLILIDYVPSIALHIHPGAHFARTKGVNLDLNSLRFKDAVYGSPLITVTGSAGQLVLQSVGPPYALPVMADQVTYVDEDAVVALLGPLHAEPVRKGLRETLTSGEGYFLAVRGTGTIYLQPRSKDGGGESVLGGVVDWLT